MAAMPLEGVLEEMLLDFGISLFAIYPVSFKSWLRIKLGKALGEGEGIGNDFTYDLLLWLVR